MLSAFAVADLSPDHSSITAQPADPAGFQYVHSPVAGGDCGVCHATSGGQNSVAVCLGCHSDYELFVSGMAGQRAHGLLECTDCHDPHYSEFEALLVSTASELCAGCHEIKPTSAQKYSHFSDECERCHDPHAILTDNYLKDNVLNLCQSDCHSANNLGASHPVGPGVYDKYAKTEMTCTSSCHRIHNSNYPTFIAAHPDKICFRCHAEIFVGKDNLLAEAASGGP